MSGENVEAFKRGTDAYNRRDVEALLEELHPRIEWRPLLPVLLGGEAAVYRGHEGARQGVRELEEAFFDFEDGKVVRIREYLDPDEALEAAGIEG